MRSCAQLLVYDVYCKTSGILCIFVLDEGRQAAPRGSERTRVFGGASLPKLSHYPMPNQQPPADSETPPCPSASPVVRCLLVSAHKLLSVVFRKVQSIQFQTAFSHSKDLGASSKSTNKQGVTPLHYAARSTLPNRHFTCIPHFHPHTLSQA
jgi:hypothetical protein